MSTAESNRLKRNIGANNARVVVYGGDDGDEGFVEGLNEDARKRYKGRAVRVQNECHF